MASLSCEKKLCAAASCMAAREQRPFRVDGVERWRGERGEGGRGGRREGGRGGRERKKGVRGSTTKDREIERKEREIENTVIRHVLTDGG